MATAYVNARVFGPDGREQGIREFVVDGDRFGSGHGSKAIDLGGSVVTPGFVDAHVHLTGTGLSIGGLDLHGVSDERNLAAALMDYVRRVPDRFVVGHGWDDTSWPAPPTRALVDGIAGERMVYLARVDGHSCLVSTRLLKDSGVGTMSGVDLDAEGMPTGVLRTEANHAVRRYLFAKVPLSLIRDAHRRAAEQAVAAGVTTVHEMAGPSFGAGERELGVLERERLPVNVVVYWASDDVDWVVERGLERIGGDLNVDGALGSRTAALRTPYADGRGHYGSRYRDADDLADFFERATRAGLQAGVHCIGDAACEAAVEGLEMARRRADVRAMRHRLEHFEMSSPELIARAVACGAGLSMQPAFDASWGGGNGMYATRVGAGRAKKMNNFKAALRAGAVLGFGSDSPVTPMDPLGAVHAATSPHVPSHAITRSHAWHAVTKGGHELARSDDGPIQPGLRADFLVWEGDPVTDPDGAKLRATIVRGKVVYGEL